MMTEHPSPPAEPIITGHRFVRGTMYVLLMLAGVAIFFIDLAFLEKLQDATIAIVGLFLIVGGGVSAAGHVTNIVVLERAGYPLFLTALMALTAVLFSGAADNAARSVFGLLTLSFTLGLYGRWRDLGAVRNYRRAMAEEYPDHGVE